MQFEAAALFIIGIMIVTGAVAWIVGHDAKKQR